MTKKIHRSNEILAADKLFNKQTLCSRGLWDPEEGPCPMKWSMNSPDKSQVDMPFGASQISSQNSEVLEYKNSLQNNVFIDSYYPKVRGDTSESTGSQSSVEEIKIFPHQSVNPNESSEIGSKNNIKEAKKVFFGKNTCFQRSSTRNKMELAKNSSNDTIATPGLDSKTYTLFSCSSEVESTFVNTSLPPSEKFPFGNTTDERQLEGGDNTVEGFNQLYRRIHNLENLLQQTMGTGERKGTVAISEFSKSKILDSKGIKPKTVNFKPDKLKAKISFGSGASKPWESTCLSIPEETDEKNQTDTDNELKNIKKRLRVLEKKLKNTKALAPVTSQPQRCYQEESLSSTSLVFGGTDGSANNRNGSRDTTDTTVSVCSESESFLYSEETILNSDGDLNGKCERSKVKKKIISKCKNIKRKCSNLISSTKNTPLKVSSTSDWKEFLYRHSVVTEESVATALLSQSYSTHTRTDSSTVLFVKCQHELPLEPPHITRKKKEKKRKYLCKKNSKTNIFSSRSSTIPMRELYLSPTPNPDDFVFDDDSHSTALQFCDSSNKLPPTSFNDDLWRNAPWKGLTLELPDWQAFWMPSEEKLYSRSHDHQQKLPKKRLAFRNPLDVLKRGGKIKIPVLFEEICKTSDKKKPEHKLSNVSMRVVVVEEDNEHPLTPLRRLIKKLSQTKPPPKADQFMFGVSKCRCDNQIQKLTAISEKNPSEFS